MPKKTAVYLFLLTAAAVLFWNAGKVPLFDPDEGRYSDIAQTMLHTGDWLTPRMDGVSHYHKPPLSNWLVAASFKIFGSNEFAARLPSILLSLALMAMLISLGRFLFNFETGYYSAWILLTSALYVAVSRLVTTDMMLVFLTFSAMNCIARLFFGKEHKIRWFYLTILCLGLAMLTKGPVAWMITLVPAFAFGIWKRKDIGVPLVHWVLGFILFWAISLSWFLVVILTNKGAFDYFIHYQLAGRILSGHAGRKQPIFYFFLVVPLGFLPWTVFMPTAVQYLRKFKEDMVQERLLFVGMWFLLPFILFTIFKTKLATYITPVFPPLALLAGFFWRKWDQGEVATQKAVNVSVWVMAAVYGFLAVGGLVFISFLPQFVAGIPKHAIVLITAVLLSAAAANVWIMKKKKTEWIFRTQVAILVVLALTVFHELPSLEYKNSRTVAHKILEIKKPGEKVILWRNYFASLPFYLQERVVTVGIEMETTFEPPENVKGWVFKDIAEIEALFKSPDRVFVVTAEKNLEGLGPFVKVPVYVLYKKQNMALASNKP